MTRAVWSGNLQFALINVPVKLHKANKDADVHFKNVHAVCHNPVNIKKWCGICNKEVLATELNKGFALAKDKLIEFSEQEIEAVTARKSKGHTALMPRLSMSYIILTSFQATNLPAKDADAHKALISAHTIHATTDAYIATRIPVRSLSSRHYNDWLHIHLFFRTSNKMRRVRRAFELWSEMGAI